MAPKKQVMSPAFFEKARNEKKKLRELLADQLHKDMLCVFQEREYADITLTTGIDKFPAHLPLIHTRLPDLDATCILKDGPKNGTEEHQVWDMRKLGISPEDVQELLLLLYTGNTVKSYWKNIKSASIKSPSVQSENADIENKRECGQSMNSEPTSEGHRNTQVANDVVNNHGICQCLNSEKQCESHKKSQINNADLAGDREVRKDENRTMHEQITRWRRTDPELNNPKLDQNSHLQDCTCNGEDVASDLFTPQSAVSNDVGKVKSLTENLVLPNIDIKDLPEPASPLGGDLLKMFVSGCGHDVTIKVEDKEISAHKFILCSRSNYFAAMLGGSWQESKSAEVNLEGVSYTAALATMMFIYGAVVDIPEGSTREIVYLADMYCLEGLKEVAAFKLRQDNCHFFHKPCSICLAGVAEALMLSRSYRMTKLYESSIRWVLKYLDRVWSNHTFASMPSEMIHQCSEFAIGELTDITAVTMVTQVDKVIHSLPQMKWTEPIFREARWLLDACIQYVASNFRNIIKGQDFEMLLMGLGWNKDLLESLFIRVMHNLTVDTANSIYAAVHGLRQRASVLDWNQDALALINNLLEMCHNYMVSNVNVLLHAPDWQQIPEELRNKIKEDAVFVDDTKQVLAPRPVLSSSQKLGSAGGTSRHSSQPSARSRSARGQRSTSRAQVKSKKPASSNSKR